MSGETSLGSTTAFARWFDRRRRWAWGFVVVTTLVTALGFGRVERARTLESRLDQDAWAVLLESEATFRVRQSDLFLVLESDDLFSAESLAVRRDLVAAVRALPDVLDVIALDRIPVVEGLAVTTPLAPAPDADEAARERARRLASEHPLVAGQLLAPDGRTLVLPVRVSRFAAAGTRGEELTERVAELAARHGARVTGLLPIFSESGQVFERERLFFMVVGFALAFLFAAALFRSLSAVIVAGVAPSLGVVWTLGALRWLGEGGHDMVSIVLPILLMMIGFTDGIHLIVNARKARAAGMSPREASVHSLSNLGGACLWTSVTTAVGFASLMVGGSAYASEFGRACALGVVLTFLAVVTTIPLLAGGRLGERIDRGWEHDPVERMVGLIERLVRFVLRLPRSVSALGILATLAMLAVALGLRPNSRFAVNMPDDSASYATLQRVDEALGGIQFGRIVVRWPEDADDARVVEALGEVQALVAADGRFGASLSPRDLLRLLPGGGRDLGAAALLPEELREAFLDVEQRSALVAFRVRDAGFLYYEPAYDALDASLAALSDAYPGFRFDLTGDPVFYGRNLAQVTRDLMRSLALAAAIILAILWFVFRSWRIGALSVFPNAFPLAVTASLLYLVEGGGLELASVCSFTICLGIAVDDTIHFLTRFQHERLLTDDLEEAILRSVRGVGAALVTTTIVLVVGFGVVLTSEIPVNRLFAGMGVATIAAALLGDLVLLPAMMKLALGGKR